MKRLLFILLFLTSLSINSQDKNISIQGYVTNSSDERLKNVNISVKNSNKGAQTDDTGFYKLNVKINDILQFSHISYQTKHILVTGETKTLNISLKSEENILDEVEITGKKDKYTPERYYQIGRGYVDINSSNYIDGSRIKKNVFTLQQSLIGLVPGIKVRNSIVSLRGGAPVLWDIDGMTFKDPPNIDLNQIKSIVILRSLAQTNAYGADGAAGVIVVNTYIDNYQKTIRDVNSPKNPYTNKEKYEGDAISYNNIKVGNPEYLDAFKAIKDGKSAIDIYKKIYPKYKNYKNFDIDMIYYFYKNYSDEYVNQLISESKIGLTNNIYDLKFIAYIYELINNQKEAISTYKRIIKLKPKHKQSYRDLANSYIVDKDYKSAWKVYKYYLNKGFTIEEDDISKILDSEMIHTFINRKKDPKFREKLYVKDDRSTMSADTRLIFEWNTSEAEFALEFVNSNGQIHKVDNFDDEIIEQKRNGYTSKEFIIDGEKGNKNWLINLTYFGNKQYKPTFLKLTKHDNWGKTNQKTKIYFYKIDMKNTKYKLLEFLPTKTI